MDWKLKVQWQFVVEGQGAVPAGGYGVLATRRAPNKTAV